MFTHSDLIEEICMEQPSWFKKYGSLVYQLKKSFYGLKQAPRAWYDRIDHLFFSLGFKCHEFGHNIYVLHVNCENLTIAIACWWFSHYL